MLASTSPDFSTMPEVVWVKVMQFLDVLDRAHVALTCSRLWGVLEHPSVWSNIIVSFWRPGFGTPPYEYGVLVTGHDVVSSKLYAVMKKFSQYIRHARLRWFDRSFTSSSFDLVSKELMRSRCLKSVVLEVLDQHLRGLFDSRDCPESRSTHLKNTPLGELGGSLLSDFIRDFSVTRDPPVKVAIEAHVSDSVHVNTNLFLGMFTCSADDARCRSLRVLRWSTGYSDIQLSTVLKVPAPTARLVSKLRSLQHLHLGVQCLSDQLLYELAETGRVSLKTLNIVFHESALHLDPLLQLSSEAWLAVSKACPDLQVHCPSLYFRYSDSLDCVLKPETPLVSVNVEDSRPEPSLLAACFSTDQASSLTSLQYTVVAGQHYLYGGQPIPGAVPRPGMVGNITLVTLVASCPRLQHLVYNNIIYYHDILRIARINRQWRTFHFNESQIITDENDDDDTGWDHQDDNEVDDDDGSGDDEFGQDSQDENDDDYHEKDNDDDENASVHVQSLESRPTKCNYDNGKSHNNDGNDVGINSTAMVSDNERRDDDGEDNEERRNDDGDDKDENNATVSKTMVEDSSCNNDNRDKRAPKPFEDSSCNNEHRDGSRVLKTLDENTCDDDDKDVGDSKNAMKENNSDDKLDNDDKHDDTRRAPKMLDRKKILGHLCRTVSRRIGYSWQPLQIQEQQMRQDPSLYLRFF